MSCGAVREEPDVLEPLLHTSSIFLTHLALSLLLYISYFSIYFYPYFYIFLYLYLFISISLSLSFLSLSLFSIFLYISIYPYIHIYIDFSPIIYKYIKRREKRTHANREKTG